MRRGEFLIWLGFVAIIALTAWAIVQAAQAYEPQPRYTTEEKEWLTWQ